MRVRVKASVKAARHAAVSQFPVGPSTSAAQLRAGRLSVGGGMRDRGSVEQYLLLFQPLRNKLREVVEADFIQIDFELSADIRQLFFKELVSFVDYFVARQRFTTGGFVEPFADDLNAGFDIILVGFNILTGDVGDEFLISECLGIKNQADFVFLEAGPILLRSQKKA